MPKKEKIIENVNKTTFAIYYGITKSFLYQYEVATLINLGKFENAGRVKIVTPDGQVFVGKAGDRSASCGTRTRSGFAAMSAEFERF